ncbi:hypothetical protein [Spirosoma aerolatum]|uniref:hypothetical protein n=1 Tax=Spirosoma aerolatum TaxID=1211326 RepID=UPI0009AC92C9|nr:hypothetical protein [Spirosoma aerolatum]
MEEEESKHRLQLLQNELVSHAQQVEWTLRNFAPNWKVCVFVWNPKELDANIVTMPQSISNEELLKAVIHAVQAP